MTLKLFDKLDHYNFKQLYFIKFTIDKFMVNSVTVFIYTKKAISCPFCFIVDIYLLL